MQDIHVYDRGRFGARFAPLADEHKPPERFYVRGDVAAVDGPCVAIVGARACSTYGAAVARTLGRELAAAGVTVVSGLARGIDAEAHRGALEADGRTVAVLGCGIDRDYPAAHAELARRIETSGGAIVSEYEPGVEPAPWRFPARNRIMAALSSVVVVVEAREANGALVTADFAMEYGHTVMAVPGEVTSVLSAGSNDLIRRHGAGLVSTPADVLAFLDTSEPPIGSPAWVRERARRGIAALEDSDVDVLREVLDALAGTSVAV